MKSYTSIVAALCVVTGTLVQAQTIKPDTLDDLKGEAEYQRQQAVPYAHVFQDRHKKRMDCAEKMIQSLVDDCDVEMKELQIIRRMMAEPFAKAEAAKEAYQRELRKVERIDVDKSAKSK